MHCQPSPKGRNSLAQRRKPWVEVRNMPKPRRGRHIFLSLQSFGGRDKVSPSRESLLFPFATLVVLFQTARLARAIPTGAYVECIGRLIWKVRVPVRFLHFFT